MKNILKFKSTSEYESQWGGVEYPTIGFDSETELVHVKGLIKFKISFSPELTFDLVAEENMTWNEYINSNYVEQLIGVLTNGGAWNQTCVEEVSCVDDSIYIYSEDCSGLHLGLGGGDTHVIQNVKCSDVIINNMTYTTY